MESEDENQPSSSNEEQQSSDEEVEMDEEEQEVDEEDRVRFLLILAKRNEVIETGFSRMFGPS